MSMLNSKKYGHFSLYQDFMQINTTVYIGLGEKVTFNYNQSNQKTKNLKFNWMKSNEGKFIFAMMFLTLDLIKLGNVPKVKEVNQKLLIICVDFH